MTFQVCLYKYLLHSVSNNYEKKWNLKYFLSRYQILNEDRLWIFPYKGGWTFSLLASFIFQRIPPTFEELLKSLFLSKWIYSRDLYEKFENFKIDSYFSILNNSEFEEYSNLMLEFGNKSLCFFLIFFEKRTIK